MSKYIADNRHSPNQRLKEILRAGPSGPSPYAGLDSLYLQIISSSQLVLGTIACLLNPLSVEQLQELLGADRVDVPLVLERLNSILLIPEGRDKAVHVFHRSLRDFLIDSRQSIGRRTRSCSHHVEQCDYSAAPTINNGKNLDGGTQ